MNTFLSPSNITTGQLATKFGEGILGKVGYFYKHVTANNGGNLEPRNVGKLVRVTGYRREQGTMVFTFTTPARVSDFTRCPDVKFAAYIDQDEANEVFKARCESYREVYKVYNTASFTEDAGLKAVALAAMEGLLSIH